MSTIQALLANQAISKVETKILLASVLQCSPSTLYTWPEKEVSLKQTAAFQALVARRVKGEPVAYLMGEREFWSLPLKVTKDTLIPRHETELLVEQVLALLPSTYQSILELGTGSGAIACALASECPSWHLLATDLCQQALNIAKQNAKQLGLQNISFSCGSWFAGLKKEKQFSAIVSNPPYLQAGDPHLVQGDLPFEPEKALVSGETGFEAYQAILIDAPNYLQAGGLLAFEHGYQQASHLQDLFKQAGFGRIQTVLDFAGLPRVTLGFLL